MLRQVGHLLRLLPAARVKGRDRWETRGYNQKQLGNSWDSLGFHHPKWNLNHQRWRKNTNIDHPKTRIQWDIWGYDGYCGIRWWVNYQTWWFQHQTWRLKQENTPCSLSWPLYKQLRSSVQSWWREDLLMGCLLFPISQVGFVPIYKKQVWMILGYPYFQYPWWSRSGSASGLEVRARSLWTVTDTVFWGGQVGKEEVRLRVGLVMPIFGNLQLIQLQSRWSLGLSQWCKDSNVSWQGWGLHDLIDDKLACLRSLVGTCKAKIASPKMVWNICNMCVDG